ncbi:MAG: DUF4139 domain-containing protein [Pseudomonadota bacterium]
MIRHFAALVAAFLTAFPAVGEFSHATGEAPPVTKVVMYKHGMGYLERQGRIDGDAMLSLAFRADQMKDILTSFFAVDLGGGRISSVRYETGDPVSRQLQEILIKVPEEAALSKFIMQLKGARLSAKAGGESVEGRILGVEPVTQVVKDKEVKTGYRVVLLTDAGPIRSLDLFAVTEFSLADEALQRDLRRLLDLSLESKYTNRKKLTVKAVGKGERDLRMGYLIEMPIWKCSYRVIFDEMKKDDSPLLQGWALAENNTEDDWKDVKISFVAGNPMSYVMDLYSPYYVKRTQVPIPGLQDLDVRWGEASPPDLVKEGLAAARSDESPRFRGRRAARLPAGVGALRQSMDPQSDAARDLGLSPPQRADAPGAPAAPLSDLLAAGYEGGAKGTKVGALFSYEPNERISIPRGQAAMVPIVSKRINGRRVLYYKASFSPRVANAFVLRNNTDLTLEAGAVTFFDGSTSLGEGILGSVLPSGSQSVIPYAIDASVDVTPETKSRRAPHFRARLVDGILTLAAMETLTNTWKIVNRGTDSTTLWLHQPKSSDYRLSKPQKPLKEVGNDYRFEVPLKAGETVNFLVEEMREVLEAVHLANSSEEQIRFYLSQPYLSPGAKAFMKEVGEVMAQKAALQRQISEWTRQSKRLDDEQTRLRSNLQALRSNLPKEEELRAKWVAALAGNEDRLTEIRAKLDESGEKVRQTDESLARKLREYKDES